MSDSALPVLLDSPSPLIRARRLFEFLTRAQELRAPRVRDVGSYEHVLWLGDLPDHESVSYRSDTYQLDREVVTLARVLRSPAPPAPRDVAPWLVSAVDQPNATPALSACRPSGTHGTPPPRDPDSAEVWLADHPEIESNFETWLPEWQRWAVRERNELQLQEIYKQLFNAYIKTTSRSDEYELVIGTVCLAWHPAGDQPVRRHLLVAPLTLDLDDDTGAMTATADLSAGLTLEADMLDPGQIPQAFDIHTVRQLVAEFADHPMDAQAVGHLGRRIVHNLRPDSSYSDALERPAIGSTTVGAFAPAIILRRRSSRGLAETLRTIWSQLEQATEVPSGLLPLVDPDFRAHVSPDPTPGGIVSVARDQFHAMPVNERQHQVIANVDSHAQTMVQGPPGTGKTHTAAALLTHLLAQGKRVLVTAQTDRALKEVRDKLPGAIRPLAVSVVGGSRLDMAELKTAVETISSAAAEHSETRSETECASALALIDELSRERAQVFQQLRDSREKETTERTHCGYRGTLAAIAQQLQSQSSTHGWLLEYVTPTADSPVPLRRDNALRWLQLLQDQQLKRDAAEACTDLVDLATMPNPEIMAGLVGAERLAAERREALVSARSHPAFRAITSLPPSRRLQLQRRIRDVARQADDLEQRHEGWIPQALRDIRSNRQSTWQNRAETIRRLVSEAAPLVAELAPTSQISIRDGETAVHVHQARGLLAHLASGSTVKLAADGSPKIGVLTAKPVKAAATLLASVKVTGLPPTTAEQLKQFIIWSELNDLLHALDRAWPADVVIPAEDTAAERFQWHRTELDQLTALLDLGVSLTALDRDLAAAGLPHPDWTTLDEIETYTLTVDAATAEEERDSATAPLVDLAARLGMFVAAHQAAKAVTELRDSVVRRDLASYRVHHDRLRRLHQAKEDLDLQDGLGSAVRAAAPQLCAAVEAQPDNSAWAGRISHLTEAWDWAAAGAWVVAQEQVDVNALQGRLDRIEDRIRGQIERLAATRAWRHAVSPERLTGTARADLTQYAQLVRRLGRGTGKYAAAQREDIRAALSRCSSAVPVWIMPIYRIAEQLEVRESMFDVVVVDEASQAGMESIFLQYLAPKIVVIGDDKQVSPSAVGVDRQQLRDLADHYLRDDRYKASWQDPERSLFDEAKMRYGNLITLIEHRRCVPEIIGFSNRIAYEPEGIRLIPVRQYGSDRLEPVVPVHVPEGYEVGTSGSKYNDPERDAIVDRIEKCIADPRYDGLTFGVISLLGAAQARRIEAQLLERLPPDEWAGRDLRCGDAADFQGSERDVILLSMVAAPSDRRPMALTRDQYVQRYNVATSRAKDQLWLFHSLQLRDVSNADDMRFQLLDYCYGVSQRRQNPDADVMITAVSENERCEPFDSLFEQRVFNRVVDRGYSVIPQFSTDSYRIDMVIVGAQARLAVECDGDRWHGPAQYADDLARQRDLERAGWQFFRIRESAFYLDRAGTMRDLWKVLDSLHIYPSDRQPTVTPSAESIEVAAVGDHLAEISEPAESTVDHVRVESVGSNPNSTDALPERLEAPAEDSATQALAALSEHEEPRATDPLPAYHVFWGELPHPAESPSAVVARSLMDIVAVEGPVARSRLFTAYIRSSEIERGGRVIVNYLAQALGRAVRSGHIVAEGRGLNITYRLPDQPTIRRRQLGPRLLSEVPTTELTALLADATEVGGGDDPDQLFREALSRLGMHRLTTDAKRILDAAFAVALASGAREADDALTPAGDESRNDPPRIDTVRPA